jgi:hypothetical protein
VLAPGKGQEREEGVEGVSPEKTPPRKGFAVVKAASILPGGRKEAWQSVVLGGRYEEGVCESG